MTASTTSLVDSWPTWGLKPGDHISLEIAAVVHRGEPLAEREPVPGCGCVVCHTWRVGGDSEAVHEARQCVQTLAGLAEDDREPAARYWASERVRLGRDISLPSPGLLVALARREAGPSLRASRAPTTRSSGDQWKGIVEEARNVTLADIVQRLGLGPIVQRRGQSEGRILCPFHDDGTPSLRLNEEKGVWRCDPCGEGKDGIDLFMRVSGLCFADTVRELAPSVRAA